jgi:hypothetical protein
VSGQRLSSASRKLDAVVVAARYTPGGALDVAQAYERNGVVWTDLVLLDRAEVVDRLRAGKRVAVGETVLVPGDYSVRDRLELGGENGSEVIRLAGSASTGDDLGVPRF